VDSILRKPLKSEKKIPSPGNLQREYTKLRTSLDFSAEKYARQAEESVQQIWMEDTLAEYSTGPDQLV
jgi:hypothetical protein